MERLVGYKTVTNDKGQEVQRAIYEDIGPAKGGSCHKENTRYQFATKHAIDVASGLTRKGAQTYLNNRLKKELGIDNFKSNHGIKIGTTAQKPLRHSSNTEVDIQTEPPKKDETRSSWEMWNSGRTEKVSFEDWRKL